MAQHCHPSVQHFANQILSGNAIEYSGNPLLDFATRAFLDRWVYVLCLLSLCSGGLCCMILLCKLCSCSVGEVERTTCLVFRCCIRFSDLCLFYILYSYKNPKRTARDRGGSAMQSQHYSFADLAAPVTAPEFVRQSAASVRDEEVRRVCIMYCVVVWLAAM